MPSDPSGVHPSGVLVRNPVDFFDDNVASGAVLLTIAPLPTNTWFRAALYNNSNAGLALKVYSITSFALGGGSTRLFFAFKVFGTSSKTAASASWPTFTASARSFVGQCGNVRPDLGTPFGQIWQRLDIAHISTRPPANARTAAR